MDLKKGFDKTLKIYISCKQGFAEDCLEVYENCTNYLSNDLWLKEISIFIAFQILLQNKQKLIRKRLSRNDLWSKPILIISNNEVKTLRKKPGDEAFRVSFKFPWCGWDQGLADFNRFWNTKTRSCYSCLVL